MIEVDNLHKRFKLADPKASAKETNKDPRQRGRFFYSVEGVSLSCQSGQVLGLVGPNGAGKTTTLRMLSGVIKPDQGSVTIDGHDLHNGSKNGRANIGFLSASTNLYERFTVEENLLYFAGLYEMSKDAANAQIEKLCEQLQMDSFRHRRVMDLSSGMKQRANIARSMVHQPKVVILDEPTTGLDIMSTEIVMEFIRSQQAQNLPVIFSTHHLEEISLLCDQLCVIDQGKATFNGPLADYAGSTDSVALRQRFMDEHKAALAEVV